MSYDLAVWASPVPGDAQTAQAIYVTLVEGGVTVDARALSSMRGFIADASGFAGAGQNEDSSSVWASDPGDDFEEDLGLAVLNLVGVAPPETLLRKLGQLARHHGLVCFDLQLQRLL